MPENEAQPETMQTQTAQREAVWVAFRRFAEGMIVPELRGETLDTVHDRIVGVGMGDQGAYYGKRELNAILMKMSQAAAGRQFSIEYGKNDITVYPAGAATVLCEITITSTADYNTSISRILQVANFARFNDRWLVISATCSPLDVPRRETSRYMKSEVQTEAIELLNHSVPGGIISFYNTPEYPVTFVNAHMLNYLGCSRPEFDALYGGHMGELIHPEDREMVSLAIMQAVAEGVDYKIQHRIMTSTGRTTWVIQRGRKIRDGAEPGQLMSVFTDVTEIITLQNDLVHRKRELEASLEVRKRQEKNLKAAAAAASEAAKAKSTFMATISHEIRTPMNGVIGFAELALDDPALPARSRDYIGKLKQSADSLLDVINDILELTKLESGSTVISQIPFRIHEILEQCDDAVSGRAAEKGIRLVVQDHSDHHAALLGDPEKLRKVLLNLLSNAVKFTQKGTITLRVRANELVDKRMSVYFEVVDTGIGMSPEEMERVFQPFVQLDSGTTRQYGGTGLGLTIGRSYIELMGGSLSLESCRGAGSRFSFVLEFDRAESGAKPGADDETRFLRDRKPMFKGEVLVCEDADANRDVIRQNLKACGLKTVLANNGREGVERVKARIASGKPFDLILMDIYMPEMDGLEATRAIRELGVQTPVVALTTNVMRHDRLRYQAEGMADCLGKPFVAKELWSCLLKFMKPGEWVPVEKRRSESERRAAGASDTAGDLMPVLTREEKDRAEDLLAGIDALLRAGDVQVLDSVDSIQAILGRLGREAEALVNQIRAYDFDDAAKTAAALRRKIAEW